MNKLYKIIFLDGSSFEGGNLKDSKWNLIPNKPIQKIKYFPMKIILENYEQYNHLIEHATILNNNQQFISKIILMAKKEDNVLIINFDILNNKINYTTEKFGEEYNKKPTSGWKVGIQSKKSKIIFN